MNFSWIGVSGAQICVMVVFLCGSSAWSRPIDGLSNLHAVTAGERPEVIVGGEWHGTQEAPAFIYDLAMTYAGQGVSVSIVLEQSERLNDVYALAGDGVEGRAVYCDALRAAMGWNRGDGRASEALAALAVRVAQTRAREGAAISVSGMGFSSPVPDGIGVPLTTYRRDYHARNIADAATGSNLVIVLVGNMHPPALKRRLVEQYGLTTVTLGMMWGPGEAWNCQAGRCHVHWTDGNVSDLPADIAPPSILSRPGRRHDRVVYLGRISASPPALNSASCSPGAAASSAAR